VLRAVATAAAAPPSAGTPDLGELVLFVRKKGQRIGHNPKTGWEVPISARRVMMFKPSNTLKLRINSVRNSGRGEGK
jgi:hypothetical protein